MLLSRVAIICFKRSLRKLIHRIYTICKSDMANVLRNKHITHHPGALEAPKNSLSIIPFSESPKEKGNPPNLTSFSWTTKIQGTPTVHGNHQGLACDDTDMLMVPHTITPTDTRFCTKAQGREHKKKTMALGSQNEQGPVDGTCCPKNF